jgi:3-deoxy-D-manno-octulosonic-acid transferase
MNLFSFSYNVALGLLALFSLPKILYQMTVHKKYRGSIKARFGLNLSLPRKNSSGLFWIHAVSVGEIKAIAPVAKLLKERYPHTRFIISSITETGHLEAKRSIPFADNFIFLPFDFSWIIRKLMDQIKPDLVLFSESDFWYHFIHYAKAQGAVVAVANGKISERSCNRFKRFPLFAKRLFSNMDLICSQNELYKDRFEQVGISKDKIISTGNLKFDAEYPRMSKAEINVWKQRLNITSDDFVFVIGSTHNPEEELFLKILKRLWIKHPHLKVLIAPRHPERFDAVAELLDRNKVIFSRLTKGVSNNAQVLLIDTMGQLKTCYQLADLALVAGSYVTHVGGHNILEPCGYGVPVLFGPYMQSQPDLLNLVLDAKAGMQVPLELLEGSISSLIKNPERGKIIGEAGLQLIAQNQGASKRTFEAIIRKIPHSFANCIAVKQT